MKTDLRLAKVAEALGWMRCERLGKEVWYDPAGGHVTWNDLPLAIESEIKELVNELRPTPKDQESKGA